MDKLINQPTSLRHNEPQTQSISLQISDKRIAKCIGENIYLLGYNGPPDHVILMANKIIELFGEIEYNDLVEIFNDYHSGVYEFKYGFNITHITTRLKEIGYKTIKTKEALKARDEFYSFQNKLLNPESKD